MPKLIAMMVTLLVGLMLLAAPPAQAGMFEKAGNTAQNAVLGWTECPKAAYNEITRASERLYVGVLVSAPASCAFNVAARYTGVVADIVTLPFGGGNAVEPVVTKSFAPLHPLP